MTSRLAISKHVSLRFLFAATALSAFLLGLWQTFLYEPPTHKYPAYEQAASTGRLTARIGPNNVSIASVSRNRFDRTVTTETGKGRLLLKDVPGESLLSSCSQWLDVAQIQIQPGVERVEIIEARIFDHRSRTLLTELDPAFGWQMVGPNLLQVYGVGKEVPELLDIWLRIHSYDGDDEVFELAPESGARALVPEGTIRLNSIPKRYSRFLEPTPAGALDDKRTRPISLVFERTGNQPERHYQIAAVSIDGRKQIHDRYIDLGKTGNGEALTFDFTLSEIDHFELRPYGGRHRFFFEAVQLPKSRGRAFSSPPTVRVPIEQAQARTVLPQFAPLQIQLVLLEGNRTSGMSFGGYLSRSYSAPTDRDKACTLAYAIEGVSRRPLSIRFLDSTTGAYVTQVTLVPHNYRAAGPAHVTAAQAYLLGTGQVSAIEISMPAAP